MINIQNLEQKFNEYTSHYDPTNERIRLKIDHIKRVANNAKLIAQSLDLSEEQINLATAIGYFHDIGRFEQIKIANTFSDKESGINHAELGITVLFQNNFIRNFISETQYDSIIQKAILNHNKSKIESNLSHEELLFSQIIRDADKLDIFYLISTEEYSMKSIFWYPKFDDNEISEAVMHEFEKGTSIDYSFIHSNADMIAIFYAYLYDLYFPISKNIIYQNKYLEIFTERVTSTFSSTKVYKQTKYLLKKSLQFLKTK